MVRAAPLILAVFLVFGAQSAHAESDAFTKFNQAFQILNQRIEEAYGVRLMEKAVDMRDGIVGVHVTSAWMGGSREGQEDNARTLFDLLRAADEGGLPVMIMMLDPGGSQFLSIGDMTGQPLVSWYE